jgi:predicted HTH domain antitoxin
MTIELPDVSLGSQPLTSEQARLDFAVGLYSGRHASLGHAAKVAGMPKILFMRELGARGVCRNYAVEDALHDVERVRQKLGE